MITDQRNKHLLEQYARSRRNLLGNDLKSVLLYGSYARENRVPSPISTS